MTDEQRIECLQRKRAELKAKIEAERARPHPDDLELQRLKRDNCRMKDETAQIAHRARGPAQAAGASAA